MIRELQWKDMNDIIENYYSYYEELAETPELGLVLYHSKPSFDDEVAWFSNLFRGTLKGNAIAVVAEEDGKVVGMCDIIRFRPGSEESHVAVLGIAIKKEFRGKGLGRKLMERGIELSKGKFELIRLGVFSVNESAVQLYKSLGFEQYGLLPGFLKRNGRYFDEKQMFLRL